MKRISLLRCVVALLLLTGVAGVVVTTEITFAASAWLKDDDCDSSGKGSGDCPEDDHDSDHDDRVDEDVIAASTAMAVPQGEFEIRIIDEQFFPASLTVNVGQTVTVVNADDDEHTATSTSFDTGTLNPGQSATFTVNEAGRFPVICQFHADMRAELIVVDPNATSSEGTPAGTPEASPVAVASPAAAGETVDVSIIDFAFEPVDLVISPGTTVNWNNAGVAPHTVTGEFGDSGILDPGGSYVTTFSEAGVFAYACLLHPQMIGEIRVE